MRYEFYSNGDVNYILQMIRMQEPNNPVINDVLRLVRLWCENEIFRPMLSFNYNPREKIGQQLLDITYCANSVATNAIWTIGSKLIVPQIDLLKIIFSANTVTNQNFCTLLISTYNSQFTFNILRILSSYGIKDSIIVENDVLVRISFHTINLEQILNILLTIQNTFSTGQFKKYTGSWC